jgi:hypothetical protein
MEPTFRVRISNHTQAKNLLGLDQDAENSFTHEAQVSMW